MPSGATLALPESIQRYGQNLGKTNNKEQAWMKMEGKEGGDWEYVPCDGTVQPDHSAPWCMGGLHTNMVVESRRYYPSHSVSS